VRVTVQSCRNVAGHITLKAWSLVRYYYKDGMWTRVRANALQKRVYNKELT